MVRSYNPFSRQWDQKTESSLNCLRDVFKDLPRLLIVADLFVTLPLQIPLNEHLKVEMVFQQAATQERVGVPLLHEHYRGQYKKKILMLMFTYTVAVTRVVKTSHGRSFPQDALPSCSPGSS